ncbi:CehA/McbA family metallohydrolase [Clostridium sardiniense]|nr:CehA/McbA family metallohydrolase [Clostridium sardiniense]MDQ0461948.1 LPXTG-motif cell wall-anchored protein [Clostridium sardiniense]
MGFKIKCTKKLSALFVAFTMIVGVIATPAQVAFAELMVDSKEEEIIVFEESFTGKRSNKEGIKAENEGWIFTRDGQVKENGLDGYDSTDNYNTLPSIGFGRGSGKVESITTPKFLLNSAGKLSFYLKNQGITETKQSKFTVSALNDEGIVIFEKIFDSLELSSYLKITEIIVEVPLETRQIKFEYTKDVGNLTFDDVKLTHKEKEEEIEGLIPILDARATDSETEVIVKGIVTFKEASGSSFNYSIEDNTAGIALRGSDGLEVGDEVVISGKPSIFNGLIQVNGYKLIENRGKKALPEGKLVKITEIVDNNGGENFESQIVKITDLIIDSIDLTGNTILKDEDRKTINLYKAMNLNDLKVKDKVEVTAVLSQYAKSGNGGYQLRINDPSQVKKLENGSEEPKPEEDKEGPAINNIKPAPSSNIGENKKPQISATFTDKTGVNMDTVKMYLDGTDITGDLIKNENTVSYEVKENLSDGRHTVKVEVADTLGNLTIKEWKFTVGTEERNLYFGQLHSHTNLSDGQGSIDEAYQYAEKNANVDFMAVTDHSNWFDNDTKASLSDGSASTAWNKGKDAADKYNKDGEFVAIYGYEMTWSGSTGGYGHINTFNTPGFETRSNKNMDLKTYYNTLKTQQESLSQLNHPGKTFGDFNDFSHYDAAIDELVTLVEVGNGEGAIRSSGYFPSYDYYTRALDKGWHVAPTNNQDNHKAKWGNANTARTVVEASDLSRESIYNAIRERRVYSTEDENLKISYTVNGNTMGSILEKTDSLEFNINVEDIDNNDNIKKISIIGDGGKVVKSIDNVNSNKKQLTFSLDSNESSYYYVRVDQEDKDIAVTAPVWVGERENVGISTVDCDTEVIVEGEEFNIETNIYNNEATALNDVKVEYYVNGSDKPIVKNIDKIEAAEQFTAKLPYKFEKAGDYTFQVKVIANVNGNVKEFKGSIDIEVVKSSQVSKVIIDGAHQNQYVTGDYAGKVTTLTALMAQNGMKAIINKEPITDKVLEGASLLMLSDPQSTNKDDYGLTPQKYTQDELDAIARFVKKGGNIVVTSKADYGDAKGEYGNAQQGNSVLEAIGAKVRFNDDQATDDVENGGQSYRLYFDDYNTESEWMKGIDTSKQFSYYSGSTLIMPKDTKNVEVLVRGHDTTYGNDADNQNDNYPIGKGEMIGVAAETLESGSRVIVSGATLFSDFEMDGLDYSNYQITEKIIKTLAPAPQIPVSKITEVRVDNDKDNNPDRFGEKVVVEGYVTAASNAAAKGNSFFDVIYIQDETAGLTVFGVSSTKVQLGQKVRITGKVSSYLGDAQVAVKNEEFDLQIIDENINLVEPTKLSTKDSMMEEKEGLLVKVSGTITRVEDQNIYVDDGSGESRVYTEGYIGSSENPGVADEWKSRVKVGDKISAIGLASEDPEGHRLRVRDSAEIVLLSEEKPEDKPDNKPEDKPENKPENKPEDTPNNKPEDKPEDKPQDKPGNSEEQKPQDKPENEGDLPDTGREDILISILAGMSLLCGGAYILFRKRKKSS